jgi:UDP-glucose 4-epimerase
MTTCLVVGGAGFIGSHLCDRLLAEGDRVVAVDDLSSGHVGNLAETRAYGSRFTFASMDVRAEGFPAFVERHRPEIVYHLAARPPRKRVDPVEEARMGVPGLLAVLRSAVKAGSRKVVFASSAAVYGASRATLPLRESAVALGRPLTPYGISKKVAEDYLRYYRRQDDLDFTSLVLANVYGPRQYPKDGAGVVAVFAGRMLTEEPPEMFGKGDHTRDFVFVDDAVNALALARDGGSGRTLNVGTGIETSVTELHRVLAEITGYVGEPLSAPLPDGDIPRSALDNELAERELGWKPWTHLEDGLRETVAYLRTA